MAKKIYMTSFKGGTGVTTCCIGLGLALAESGERTLIVDGDTKSGNAMLIANLRNMQVYTLADYERGACRAKQTILTHPKTGNLCFMPSLNLKDLSAAAKAVTDVDGLFDYILLDKIAIEVCDSAFIVTEPFLPSVKSADCCRSALADGGIKDIGLVVNKINGGQILSGDIMTAQEIATVLHTPLKAVIPEDLTLCAGKWRQSTLKAFGIAAQTVTGKKESFCNVLKGYAGMSGYFKRKMREKI
ncbi:MAG: septum site-determining protein MinD [Clostridia bacterium]|nr:septum site-determining protein MinD [Clostridia bacterium]